MGLPPKPKEVAFEKYLKRRGMTYGQYRKEQTALYAKNPSAMKDFEQHYEKHGRKNAPDPQVNKTNKTH